MTNNNIVNKYGCIFEVEETDNNMTTIWAASADNTIQVKFAVQTLATDTEPEPYWRGQVDDYNIPDHDDRDRFICGVYGDLCQSIIVGVPLPVKCYQKANYVGVRVLMTEKGNYRN